MSGQTSPLAFPAWREYWAPLDGLPGLLAEADAVLGKRAAGNQRFPYWNPRESTKAVELAMNKLRAWAGGRPPPDISTHPEIIRRIHATVHPALKAAAWPRWLLLERAFLDGSATGDLAFTALTLRSMCEEVQRLHALDLDADQLAVLAASRSDADMKRLELFLSFAQASLGTIPRGMVLHGRGWPSLKLIWKAMPQLEEARKALDSYVHPNFGSHIAALYPEQTAGAKLQLEALLAVYDAFFSLSWTKEQLTEGTVSTGVGPLVGWDSMVRHFRSRILPKVRKPVEDTRTAQGLEWASILDWLARDQSGSLNMLGNSKLVSLVNELPQAGTGGRSGVVAERYKMWDGACAEDVLSLLLARQAERQLAGEFPSGAPNASDQVRQLRFGSLSLQLAKLLDAAKAAAFKAQLVRQITQGNCLGILLCVRSLVEHRALVAQLPEEVHNSLKAMAGKFPAGIPLPEIAEAVERPIADCLSADAENSREDRRIWVRRKIGVRGTFRLKLTEIVERAFPEDDRYRTFYALASAAVHGRIHRGLEIALDGEKLAMNARYFGLLTLERLCDRDAEMDHTASAGRRIVQLDHAS